MQNLLGNCWKSGQLFRQTISSLTSTISSWVLDKYVKEPIFSWWFQIQLKQPRYYIWLFHDISGSKESNKNNPYPEKECFKQTLRKPPMQKPHYINEFPCQVFEGCQFNRRIQETKSTTIPKSLLAWAFVRQHIINDLHAAYISM